MHKAVAIATELVHRIEAEQGNWMYWDYDIIRNGSGFDTFRMQRSFAQKVFMQHLKNAYICDKNSINKRECAFDAYRQDGSKVVRFTQYGPVGVNKIVLPDGTGIWFDFPMYSLVAGTQNKKALRLTSVNIDLNISKDKMYEGIDFFSFSLNSTPQGTLFISSVKHGLSSGWSLYLPKCGQGQFDSEGNQHTAVDLCLNPTLDDYYGYPQAYCSVLIECNDWKIPDDYPIKF